MFLDRDAELAFLRSIQMRTHPGPGQFIMRCRAACPSPTSQSKKSRRRKLFATLLGRNLATPTNPTFKS